MARSEKQSERAEAEITDLESYRRLIELQKQMIELSQQHERARREYAALQVAVAREVVAQQGALSRWRLATTKLLKRAPFSFARQLFS